MFKKTVASVGLAVAATAGAAFLMGSPASAETLPASAQATAANVQTAAADIHTAAHVQTREASTARHSADYRDRTDYRYGDRYNQRSYDWRNYRYYGRYHHGRHHTVIVQHRH
jgi:hypothetical protein